MRTRITRAFLTAAAAGATAATLGLATAGSAAATTGAAHAGRAGRQFGLSGGSPVYTAPCSSVTGFTSNASPLTFGPGGCAGYVGSGRNFQYVQALIRVPLETVISDADEVAPTLYVGLTSSDSMAIAGLITCQNYDQEFGAPSTGPCSTTSPPSAPLTGPTFSGQWVGFAAEATNNGAVVHSAAISISPTNPGDGVKFQVFYPAGGAAHFTITLPSGAATSLQLPASGTFNAVFNHAVALVDYSATDPYPELTPGPASGPVDLRLTQFQEGAWTTTGGTRGTFSGAGGKWTLTPGVLTSNGTAPPLGTVQVTPAYLWNDGLGGGAGDAFGVWWRV
ncbi:MAG TPA: hypothetical protein VIX86_27475, partial [Streptosporangiaceae bacterium]